MAVGVGRGGFDDCHTGATFPECCGCYQGGSRLASPPPFFANVLASARVHHLDTELPHAHDTHCCWTLFGLRLPLRHAARRQVYADVTSGLRCWSTRVGLGVGRLDQLLQDDAVKEALAPDAILQVRCQSWRYMVRIDRERGEGRKGGNGGDGGLVSFGKQFCL